MLLKNSKNVFIDKKLDENKKEIELEKGDFTAMLIAGFVTFLPAMLLVFALFGLIIALLFGVH